MEAAELSRAVAAATSIAASFGLAVDDAVILHNSNKLTLRLVPCDVVARVAPAAQQVAQFEIDLARQLVALRCPVAALEGRIESRVYERDEFVITFWTYYRSLAAQLMPVDYADALGRLHAGMRTLDLPAPRFTDRVDEAEELLANSDQTPALADADRELLRDTLRSLRHAIVDRGRVEQLLHGEPHAGNVLATAKGPVFVDLETSCRGPVEFDLAHAPEDVAEHYPNVDQHLLRQCRMLVLAMITTWRWDRTDQFPNGHRLAAQWMGELRKALRV
jgi:aminoglycoside phosphotransferase (APT) family kinase protein